MCQDPGAPLSGDKEIGTCNSMLNTNINIDTNLEFMVGASSKWGNSCLEAENYSSVGNLLTKSLMYETRIVCNVIIRQRLF